MPNLQIPNPSGKRLEEGTSAKKPIYRRARISPSSEKTIQHSYAAKITRLLQVIEVPQNSQGDIKKSSKRLLQKLLNESNIVGNNFQGVSLPLFCFEYIIIFLLQCTTEPQFSTASVSSKKRRQRKSSTIAQENAEQKAITNRNCKQRLDYRTSQNSYRMYAAKQRFEPALQESP